MIDRVARAICEAEGFGWESLLGPHETEHRQGKYRGLARAAIAAMRKPTGAMLDAAGYEPEIAQITYPAMIDAALIDK